MNILSEPLVNYVFFFFFRVVRESWFCNLYKKIDSQFIQNRAALVYMLLLLHIIQYNIKV